MTTHVADKEHAVLGPSGWDRWSVCPGSVPLTENMPRSSSSYAKEGTAAHALLEDCIEGGFDAEDLIGRSYEVEGEVFIVDMDMADAVNTAIAWIRQEIDAEHGDVLMQEQQVPIAQLTGETDATGTADVIGICDGGKLLVVMDYKHGQGVQVYASGLRRFEDLGDGKTGELPPQPNGQMAMYGLGALHMLEPIYDQIERVKLVVMQPRMDWHDSFELTVEELRAFGAEVTEAAGRVELNRKSYFDTGDVELVPGDKQCRFCDAKHFCPALKSFAVATLAPASEATDFDDLTLPKKAASLRVGEHNTPEQLAEIMRAEPLISDFLKAVRAEVERRLMAGEPVPGFYLGVGKAGNRKWRDEEEAALELTKSGRLKADEAYVKKPISPTQAEKLLKKRPKIWAKIAPLITQAPGGPSVCKDGDSNPVYRLASEPDDFQDLTALPEAAEVDPLS